MYVPTRLGIALPRYTAPPVEPLAGVPAVVAALDHAIDLLPGVLTDVADPQVARLAIEVPAERVAVAVRPDLAARTGDAGERVVGGDVVHALRRVDVEPQYLAEQRVLVLARSAGVVSGSTVAEAEVQHAVEAEL